MNRSDLWSRTGSFEAELLLGLMPGLGVDSPAFEGPPVKDPTGVLDVRDVRNLDEPFNV